MGKANALLRHEDHMIGIEDNNKGVLVILPEHVRQNQVLICDEGSIKKSKKRLRSYWSQKCLPYPKIGKKKMVSS